MHGLSEVHGHARDHRVVVVVVEEAAMLGVAAEAPGAAAGAEQLGVTDALADLAAGAGAVVIGAGGAEVGGAAGGVGAAMLALLSLFDFWRK